MTGSFQAVNGSSVTFHDASRLGIGNRDALVGTISDVNIFITHIQIAGYTGCLKDIGLERKKGGGEETKLIKDRFKNVYVFI